MSVCRPGPRAKLPLLTVFLSFFLTATAQAVDDFGAHSFVLDNGLKVVVIEDHRAPIVTHMVWYRIGSVDEFRGKSGLAHYLEHLMFKGTEKIPAGEFSKIVARNGGEGNAFTSLDYTGYYQRVAADRLPLVMRMEADRMTNLKIDPDEAVQELQVVIEERRSRIENSPTSLFGEQMRAAQYIVYPYRVPVIGWMHDLEKLTRDDALGFYRHFYAPRNAILVVSGDVTMEQVRILAEKFYGPVPNGPTMERFQATEPPQIIARRIIMEHSQVRKANWSRTYIAPSYLYGRTELAAPLQVFAEILGGTPTSRLYQELVVRQKVAIDVASWYQARRRGPGEFSISITPKDNDTERLELALEKAVADILETGFTLEEIERTKNAMASAAIYARDSNEFLANLFGRSLVIGMTIDDIENWSDQIRAVTVEQVLEAANTVLVPEKSVTGILLPASRPAGADE